MSTRFPGYRGRLPSQAKAEGVPLSEAEALAFELAARRAYLDGLQRDAIERGEDCPFHPGWGHAEGEDPRYADSDYWQRARQADADRTARAAEVDALYDPTR